MLLLYLDRNADDRNAEPSWDRNAEQTTVIKKRTRPCVRLFRLDHIFVVIVYINNRLVHST